MESFITRLSSYGAFPVQAYVFSVQLLARFGFYYDKTKNCIACSGCNWTLNNFQPGNDPIKNHNQTSPRCPLVHSNDKENANPQATSIPFNHSGARLDHSTSYDEVDHGCPSKKESVLHEAAPLFVDFDNKKLPTGSLGQIVQSIQKRQSRSKGNEQKSFVSTSEQKRSDAVKSEPVLKEKAHRVTGEETKSFGNLYTTSESNHSNSMNTGFSEVG